MGDYTLAFILAGIPPIFGATFMCLIYKIKSPVPSTQAMSNLENPLDSSGEALVASQTATTVLSAQLEVETESLLKPKGNRTVKGNVQTIILCISFLIDTSVKST